MGRYGYQIVGLVLLGFLVAVLYFVQSQRGRSAKQKYPWASVLLIWPVRLDRDRNKRAGQVFTRREWLGWLVVVVLIACGVLFFH